VLLYLKRTYKMYKEKNNLSDKVKLVCDHRLFFSS